MSDPTPGSAALEAAANASTGKAPIESVTVQTTAQQGEPADDGLGEGGKKALAAERKARSDAEKAAAEMKAKLDRIEAANLSDLERAQKAAKEAEDLAAKATLEAMRYRIAAEHGITTDAELILTAPDEETMRRQAALWSERAGAATSTAPRPDLTQGAQRVPALNSDALTQALERAVGR